MLEAIGDQSPMGLLWNFMGASAPYTIFGGLGELIGGLLLTNRRTALLGALISAAVMSQVVMLNFSYDVPVKIYSSELLLTARVLIAPYGVAHVKIGWDAIRTKWAPELYKGTPIEMGYPRKPAGNLPAGKYQLRVATPLLKVVEGDGHELTAPKIDMEIGKP